MTLDFDDRHTVVDKSRHDAIGIEREIVGFELFFLREIDADFVEFDALFVQYQPDLLAACGVSGVIQHEHCGSPGCEKSAANAAAPSQSKQRTERLATAVAAPRAYRALRRLPAARVKLLGFLVAHRAGEDDVLALFPIGRCRHAMFGVELQGIDDAQHLVEIASRRHRID